MEQVFINWLLAGFGGLLGFMLKAVWDEIKTLKKTDTQFAEKLASIEVLVAGNYVTRDEFNRNISALFKKLDAIHSKLDSKADKP